ISESNQAQPDQDENETPPLLHKLCVVESINPPLEGEVVPAAASFAEKSDITDTDASTQADDTIQDGQPSRESMMLSQTDADQALISWLAKRIGHGKLIYATG